MSSTSSENAPLKRGDYAAATDSQLRGPCPFINSLANHGYIPRDGRNVHAAELTTALRELGISTALTTLFVQPIFEEYRNPKQPPQRSFLGKMWYYLRHPWAILKFGMRNPGQFDTEGRPVLNLDQLAVHDVVEHDISLTRRDIGQGDNLHRQPDLVEQLISLSPSSNDDPKEEKKQPSYTTLADFAALRNRRIVDQRAANPGLTYGKPQHQVACGEIALVLAMLGDRGGDHKSARSDWVRAFFAEERFPVREGWRSRTVTGDGTIGVIGFALATEVVKKAVGLKF